MKSALSVLLLTAIYGARGCIYEFGTKEGSGYTYGYNGQDWVNTYPLCSGTRQSPLLLPEPSDPTLFKTVLDVVGGLLGGQPAKSSFSYGSVSNPTITNNGHTLQATLPASFVSNVQIPYRGPKATATGTSFITSTDGVSGYVKATPAQFHFHTNSEHFVAGKSYPLEMHIVHFIKPDQLPSCTGQGCPVVLGFLFQLTTNPADVKPEIQAILTAAPLNENTTATVPGTVNIGNLLPGNMTYYTYEGSLTTPPCSEGILWHVLDKPLKITQQLLNTFKLAVSDYTCPEEGHSLPAAGGNGGFQFPPADAEGCRKLGDGTNHRVTQPTNNRPIKLIVH